MDPAAIHRWEECIGKASSQMFSIYKGYDKGKWHLRAIKLEATEASRFFVSRKPLAGRVVQKRLLPMRKNKTPSVIVEMRSGNCKLQNKGRSLKNE